MTKRLIEHHNLMTRILVLLQTVIKLKMSTVFQHTQPEIRATNLVKITCGASQSIAAIVIYTGGPQGLRNASIITALSFSTVILLIACAFSR